MKVIIAGSRSITDYSLVELAVKTSGFTITEVVSGQAPGVDTLGERYALINDIPIKPFPANWKQHGKAAGPIRNEQMARYADALIAIWNNESKGTAHMIAIANKLGLRVYTLVVSNGGIA